MELTASFDDGESYELDPYTYAGGAFGGTIGPQVLIGFANAKVVHFSDQRSDFRASFPLINAVDAIKQLECFGDL